MKVKNISENVVAISNIPSFKSGEVRDVDKETGQLILKNFNFEEVKREVKKKK